MKSPLLVLLIMTGLSSQLMSQSTLIDRHGIASFYSEAPLEDIEAENKEVLGAINLEEGTLAVSMLIKGFHFDKSLMEEHFNENYLESDKYPKAIFKGKILEFAELDLTKTGSYEVEAEGELMIHGVTKPLIAIVNFDISSSSYKAATTFDIRVADFDIDIPKLVFKNIAEVVEVKASFNFIPKGQ